MSLSAEQAKKITQDSLVQSKIIPERIVENILKSIKVRADTGFSDIVWVDNIIKYDSNQFVEYFFYDQVISILTKLGYKIHSMAEGRTLIFWDN